MDENQSVCHVCNQKFPTFELEMHFLECQMQDDNGNQHSESQNSERNQSGSYAPHINSELMPDQSCYSNYVHTLQNDASDYLNDTNSLNCKFCGLTVSSKANLIVSHCFKDALTFSYI